MAERPVNNLRIGIAVFACGAFVMAYEIVASRILAPYIGTSTYIWTSLIGVILASLSLGYWLGGRMADRRPDVRVLSSVIFFAGGLVAVTELVKEIVLSFVASAPIGIELRSVLASLLLFAPASVCLGFVTPYAVKLEILSLANSGKTVGRLYALSTVGSIAGTFVAGFFLIPFVGSTRTLYIISGGLIGVAVILFPFTWTRTAIGSIVVVVFSIISNEASIYLMKVENDVHDIDTEYSRIRVFNTVDPHSGQPIRALATDPYAIQSAMRLDNGDPVFAYINYYRLARYFNPNAKRSLMIGGAGYTVPKDLLRRYQDLDMDVVEIDPGMTRIARSYFGLTDNERMRIFHEDGRTFLNKAPAGSYDAVLMDAFSSLFSVPYQLTTRECVTEIKRSLSEDGVVIFNLGSAISGAGSGFLQSELATYRSVFPTVMLFKVYSDLPDDRLQNLIIVALNSPQTTKPESVDQAFAQLLSHQYASPIGSEKPILTDDLAPVEYYNAIAQDLNQRVER